MEVNLCGTISYYSVKKTVDGGACSYTEELSEGPSEELSNRGATLLPEDRTREV